MTSRFNLSEVWATSGEAVDPDTDTAHPVYADDRYITGWDYSTGDPTENKQPYKWRNFMVKKTGESLKSIAELGLVLWDELIHYKKGSLVMGDDGRPYQSTTPNVGIHPTGDRTGSWVWAELAVYSRGGFYSLLNEALTDLEIHKKDEENPHLVQPRQFANGVGYTDKEIDSLYEAFLTDIQVHEGRHSAHGMSRTQLGVLSARLGGTFEGQVDFDSGFTMGKSSVSWSRDRFSLYSEGFLSLGIRDGGYPVVGSSRISDRTEEMFHEGNYHQLRQELEARFSPPVTLLHVPLVSDLSAVAVGGYIIHFDRPSTLDYTNIEGVDATLAEGEDGYGANGIAWSDDTTLTLQGSWGLTYLVWREDGVFKAVTKLSWDGDIGSLVSTGVGYIRDFRVLNDYPDRRQASKMA